MKLHEKLQFVYDFIKKMLQDEYLNVYIWYFEPTKLKKKIRKKQIKVTNEYYNNNVLNTNRFV